MNEWRVPLNVFCLFCRLIWLCFQKFHWVHPRLKGFRKRSWSERTRQRYWTFVTDFGKKFHLGILSTFFSAQRTFQNPRSPELSWSGRAVSVWSLMLKACAHNLFCCFAYVSVFFCFADFVTCSEILFLKACISQPIWSTTLWPTLFLQISPQESEIIFGQKIVLFHQIGFFRRRNFVFQYFDMGIWYFYGT